MTSTTSTVLTIDVGNTRTKISVMQLAENNGSLPDCLQSVAFAHSDGIDWSVVEQWAADAGTSWDVGIAGSQPQRIAQILASWPSFLNTSPKPISKGTQLPISNCVEHPEKVGLDRLLNGVAVNQFRSANKPAIVVDSGTATTVDALDSNGCFLGGAILPGYELAAKALNQYTELLPLIASTDLKQQPTPIIGRNTTQALQSGISWGFIGGVKQVVERMQEELTDEPLIVLTGGNAYLLKPHLPEETLWLPQLSSQGLAIATICKQQTEIT